MTTKIYNATARVLRGIDQIKDKSAKRALLANIRNTINREAGSNLFALAYIFEKLPEELLGYRETLNDYEKAILTAVQLYALHQQANENSVLKLDYNEGEKRQNLGDVLSTLRSDDSKSIDSRFNVMITASNFTQLQNRLRQLIKILKSEKSGIKVDYASLADDLYWFLKNRKAELKIKWGRSYYKFRKDNEKGENSNDKQK